VKVRATGDLRAHPPEVVGHRLAHPAIPRSVDRRPPWQVACRLRLRRAGARDRTRALVLSFHTCTFTRKPQPELMEKILAKGHFGQFGGMEVS
jgi:hypothetical protein